MLIHQAIATDYDGTLATHARVDRPTLSALQRFRDSGRQLIMVTGREINDLRGIFPEVELFDRIVAENGAVLYHPGTRKERVLAAPANAAFVEAMRARGVDPLSVGRSIVATHEPHHHVAIELIKELGLELQVTFNKGSVMILPPGVNKKSGLLAALAELRLSPRNVVGVGDAENDHALLRACGLGVAVANALPSLKAEADLVTAGDRSRGVVELMEAIVADDLDSIPRGTARASRA